MNKLNKKGFTLVEILAVIVILSLLIVITTTKGFGAFDNTKTKISQENMNAIKEACKVLLVEVNECDGDLIDDFVDNTADDVDDNIDEDNDDDTLNDKNKLTPCDKLKKKFESCTDVKLGYLIDKRYISGTEINEIYEKDNGYSIEVCLDGTIDINN